MKRESLKLQDLDWFYLQEVAFDTGSIYSGKPSWRRLVATKPRLAPAPVVQGPSSSDLQRVKAAAEKRLRKLVKRESGD
jgi:hypothetical protein